MAKLSASDVLGWFREQPKDAAQVVLEIAGDELDNRPAEPKPQRQPGKARGVPSAPSAADGGKAVTDAA